MSELKQEQVGFIGLGAMGSGMALNLQKYLNKQGQPGLIYYNRTISKGDAIKEIGGVPASNITELASKCDIVFLCLANDTVVNSAFDDILKAEDAIKDTLFIDCTTVHPDTSYANQQRVVAAGSRYIASPVFGASPVARAGKLIFVPSGEPSDLTRIEPYVVGVMGRSIISLGTDVRKSLTMKIVGNTLIIGLMELIGEVQVFGEAAGIDILKVEGLIREVFGPVMATYSERLSKGVYLPSAQASPQFSADNALKDGGHALNIAGSLGVQLPIIDLVREHLNQAKEMKGPNIDCAAVYGTLRVKAGLDFENDYVKQREAEKRAQ